MGLIGEEPQNVAFSSDPDKNGGVFSEKRQDPEALAGGKRI